MKSEVSKTKEKVFIFILMTSGYVAIKKMFLSGSHLGFSIIVVSVDGTAKRVNDLESLSVKIKIEFVFIIVIL